METSRAATASEQKAMWVQHAAAERPTRATLRAPAEFQRELAWFLDCLLPHAEARVVEVGCEFGVTSYLLRGPTGALRKLLIDYNEDALAAARALWADAEGADTYCGDLFALPPALHRQFDLVFSAGVIEHYAFDDRVRMIAAMRALAKPGRPTVIAFPNHYSLPYHLVYRLRTAFRIWRFPREHALYDLERECTAAFGKQIARVVLADDSVFRWSDPWYLCWLKPLFWLLTRLSKVEGYLTVCVVR